MIVYAMRSMVYHGRAGYHIGSRGENGLPISIWTPTHAGAVTIRQAYRDCEAGRIDRAAREAIVDGVLLGPR